MLLHTVKAVVSRVDARFRAIVGPGPTTLVRPNPGDPKQDGLWVQYQPIDVFTEGEYEITYSAKDSAGNTSEIKRKVIKIIRCSHNLPERRGVHNLELRRCI